MSCLRSKGGARQPATVAVLTAENVDIAASNQGFAAGSERPTSRPCMSLRHRPGS